MKINQHRRGFTLLEVLIAFIILGLSTGVILSVFSSLPTKAQHAANERAATMSAQSLLALIGSEWPLEPGLKTGELHDGTKWSLTIKPYMQDIPPDQSHDVFSPVTKLFLVTIETTAPSKWDPTTVSITTMRLKRGDI